MWCNNDTYLSNLKTAPFLHIFSAIAIECYKLEENPRGGFLVEDTFGQMPKIRKSLSNASRKQITDIVKTTLATSTIKLNMVEALVLAATDDTIHLGGKYFLFRRNPKFFLCLYPLMTHYPLPYNEVSRQLLLERDMTPKLFTEDDDKFLVIYNNLLQFTKWWS